MQKKTSEDFVHLLNLNFRIYSEKEISLLSSISFFLKITIH